MVIKKDDSLSLCGIKLTNTEFEDIVSVVWTKLFDPFNYEAKWHFEDIPVGQCIVGLNIGLSDYNKKWAWISRVGFRMATVHSVDQQKVPDFIPT